MFSSRKQTMGKSKLEMRHTFGGVKILKQSNSLPRDALDSPSLLRLKQNVETKTSKFCFKLQLGFDVGIIT